MTWIYYPTSILINQYLLIRYQLSMKEELQQHQSIYFDYDFCQYF